MAYDPMGGFQIGQSVGKSKRSAYGTVTDALPGMAKDKAARNDKLNDALLTELFKASIESPKDKAMSDYYRASTDYMKGGAGGTAPTDVSSIAQQSGMSEEDYILKPTITRFKGKASVVNTPTLKDPLDAKSTNELGQFRTTRQNLQKNLELINPGVEKRMNPLSYSASRLPGSTMALRLQGAMGDKSANDFATFKAETDKVFQQFRKATTGAQAALKELGWLEPDYPMPSDPPDLYRQKANEAIKRLEDGENLLLDLYSQRGFRVGEMRNGMNTLQQAASDQSAPRDPKQIYNQLRAQGVEPAEAKRQAGIR